MNDGSFHSPSRHEILQTACTCGQVCERLPVMDIHWNAPTQASTAGRDGDDGAVEEAETWDVEIHIRRQGRRGGTAASVYAPRFPKVRSSWGLCALSCLSFLTRLTQTQALRVIPHANPAHHQYACCPSSSLAKPSCPSSPAPPIPTPWSLAGHTPAHSDPSGGLCVACRRHICSHTSVLVGVRPLAAA